MIYTCRKPFRLKLCTSIARKVEIAWIVLGRPCTLYVQGYISFIDLDTNRNIIGKVYCMGGYVLEYVVRSLPAYTYGGSPASVYFCMARRSPALP